MRMLYRNVYGTPYEVKYTVEGLPSYTEPFLGYKGWLDLCNVVLDYEESSPSPDDLDITIDTTMWASWRKYERYLLVRGEQAYREIWFEWLTSVGCGGKPQDCVNPVIRGFDLPFPSMMFLSSGYGVAGAKGWFHNMVRLYSPVRSKVDGYAWKTRPHNVSVRSDPRMNDGFVKMALGVYYGLGAAIIERFA